MRMLDVSHHQGKIDWKITRSRHIYKVMIRAKYGMTNDTQFLQNWVGAATQNIDRGAYMYYLYGYAPGALVDAFYQLISNSGAGLGELAPVLDLEHNGKERRPDALYIPSVLKTLELMTAAFGRLPYIYSAPSFIESYLRDPRLAEYPLWIANYVKVAPYVPMPWFPDEWDIWQFSARGDGKYYGASSQYIDLNVFKD